ncbi:MAG: hypothetical protein KFH98_11145 [Gemmatimonadetes bacterium]|nr:hypothetical protein [Gemmatimonadota bacterium]
MTQPSRTTETINRDNDAIRDIMHRIRELTVPDRATLAVGLIGHLATLMNRAQMSKLMQQLQEEAERVQDVPPSRQRDVDQTKADAAADAGGATLAGDAAAGGAGATPADRGIPQGARRESEARAGQTGHRGGARDGAPDPERAGVGRGGREAGRGSGADARRAKPRNDVMAGHVTDGQRPDERVGQGGRGEFRPGRLL